MLNQIEEARKLGYDDDEILTYLHQNFSGMQNSITDAVEEGYGSTEILQYLGQTFPSERLKRKDVNNLGTNQSDEIEQVRQSQEQNRGFMASVKRGLGSGVSGIATGQGDQTRPQDESIIEHLGSILGETVSDLPAMIAGGIGGGAAGGTFGSVVPGIGTAVGSTVGAASGGFALPAAIKSAYQEYLDYSKYGKELSFGEFLESAGRVTGQAGKSAIIGAATSQAAKFLPVLKKLPGFDKLLATKVGKSLEKPISELATMTGAEAVIDREVPTLQSIVDNATVLAGFKGAEKLSGAIKNAAHDIRNQKTSREKKPQKLIGEESDIINKEKKSSKPEPEPVPEGEYELSEDEIKVEERFTAKEIHEKKSQEDASFFDKVKRFVPEKTQQAIEKISEIKDANKREKKFFEITDKHIDKQRGKYLKSILEWRKTFDFPVEQEDGTLRNFTEKEMEELIYARQKTGNPYIKDDTYEKLKARLPPEADMILETIDSHFKNWMVQWNENTATTRKINPREGLEDIYLPGMWKENDSTFKEAEAKAAEIMRKHPDKLVREQFKKDGPFVNQKVFTTYNDAIKQAGLTPKYKNIKDILQAYDNMMIRIQANNDLLAKLKKWEKDNGESLIIRSSNKEQYEQAKKDGWVPFDDMFLRRHISGKEKDGKPIFSTTSAPALVHPDAASALRGIFRKNAHKSDSQFWKAYDKVGNFLKVWRVSLSPFHYVPLTESGIATMGIKKFLKAAPGIRHFYSDNWWDDAAKSLEDIDGLVHRAEMGLQFEVPDQNSYNEGQDLIEDVLRKLEKKVEGTFAESKIKSITDKFMRYQKFLFGKFHPRMKIASYDHYVKLAVDKYIKEGKTIDAETLENIERDIAEIVNNQFGGQVWEKIKFMNDPQTMKWARRAIGYPDWTISAARQAADAFSDGLKGDLARRYWIKYGAAWFMGTAIARFMMGGLYNDKDDENKIKWSRKEGLKSLHQKDISQYMSFPLPDIDIEVGSVSINPGRDENGKKLYAHFGKQALEIPRYATDTIDALFSKSNPVIQALWKQGISSTPYKGGSFPVRGKFSGGQFKEWDATRPGTVARGVSRAKELVGEVIPFSIKGLSDRGIATTIAAGGGSLPVAKGLSLRKAEPYVFDALRKRNIKKLNKIVEILKDNKYTDAQIKSMIGRIRKEWMPNQYLLRVAERTDKES